MKYIWNLSLKNLFRNKLRSSVSIIAIAISVCVVVMLRGLIMGMIDSMVSLELQYSSGHIKVIDKEYESKERLLSLQHPVDGFNGEGAGKMEQELTDIQGVERVLSRLKFGAAATVDGEMVSMMAMGVQPEDEIAFTNVENNITNGRMVEMGKTEIALGTRLLVKINKNVGDSVTILFTDSFGSFRGYTFNIVGEIESGLKLLDEKVMYLPLDTAQNILDMPGMATELLLVTENYRDVKSYLPNVRKVFDENGASEEYLVQPWQEVNPMISMLTVAKHIYNIIYVMLIFLACFVVINTMVMIIKERTKEIGMMTALGLKSRDILYMFIMEGTVMGVFGSLLGVILGGIGNKILSEVGLNYAAALSDMDAEFLFKPIIYPVFTYENLIFSFILGVIITAIACIIPARRAAELEPTDALRQ